MSTIGTPTRASDGQIYRSALEATFVSRFLFEKVKYQYEPPYPDPHSNLLYDFYLPEFDLYIELAGLLKKTTIDHQLAQQNEVWWLNVPFHEKNQAKQLGARWSPLSKRWYVNPLQFEDVQHTFNRWNPEQNTIHSSKKSSITEAYQTKLQLKIKINQDLGRSLLVVKESDVDRFLHLEDLIAHLSLSSSVHSPIVM